jgi:hypothetical protein
MHRNYLLIATFKRYIANAKFLGLGVAVATAAIAGQANAQIDIQFSDNSPLIPAATATLSARSASQPIVQEVNRYSLNENGNLNGQIAVGKSVAGQMQVFLMQNKGVVQTVETDRLGEFTLTNVSPGRYSIIAAGNNHMGAQGVMIDRANRGVTNQFFTLSTIKTQYRGVQELVTNNLPQKIANQVPGSVMQPVSISVSEAVVKQVRIVNGKLRGQVASLVSEANVEDVQIHLLQNNQPVAQVETDALGSFVIPDFQPGHYDLVATGSTGFAAMQIEAMGKRSPMMRVSYRQAVSSVLNVPLAEDCPCGQTAQAIDYANNSAVMEAASQAPIEYACESIGCGGACGGAGGSVGNFSNLGRPVLGLRGGGGGLLGGGGLGANAGGLSRLITLGSIAGSVVALADDDDASPSSPNGSE